MLATIVALTCSRPAFAGTIIKTVPAVAEPGAKYLFYLHGQALERGGRHAQSYDYSGILRSLASRGFVVIGEERGPVRNRSYAENIATQARQLLGAGVPASNITMAGHSKGGMIVLLAMSLLAEPDIAYVNFAGCGSQGSEFSALARYAEQDAPRARGRFLSVYDRGDKVAGSCELAMEKMSQANVKELTLNRGVGHELFYTPDPSWLDILQAWAERREP